MMWYSVQWSLIKPHLLDFNGLIWLVCVCFFFWFLFNAVLCQRKGFFFMKKKNENKRFAWRKRPAAETERTGNYWRPGIKYRLKIIHQTEWLCKYTIKFSFFSFRRTCTVQTKYDILTNCVKHTVFGSIKYLYTVFIQN